MEREVKVCSSNYLLPWLEGSIGLECLLELGLVYGNK